MIDWAQGRLVFRNATLLNVGVMNIAATEDAVLGATTGTLENRGVLNKTSEGVMRFSSVLLKQNGTMNAIGTTGVTANRFEQNGVFSPGLGGAGMATVTGNFPQTSDGTMLIELAGDNAYDQLKISGEATLRGDLKIALVGGYVPAEGTKFTALEFGSRVGAFDALVGLNLSSTLMLEPTFSETNLVFTVKARPVPIFSNSRVERPSGLPIFTISGIAGQTFVLEARDSFEPGTNWTDVLTSADSSVIYEFIDQDRANHLTRYFRVRRLD